MTKRKKKQALAIFHMKLRDTKGDVPNMGSAVGLLEDDLRTLYIFASQLQTLTGMYLEEKQKAKAGKKPRRKRA